MQTFCAFIGVEFSLVEREVLIFILTFCVSGVSEVSGTWALSAVSSFCVSGVWVSVVLGSGAPTVLSSVCVSGVSGSGAPSVLSFCFGEGGYYPMSGVVEYQEI